MGGLITSRPIMFIGIQRYDIIHHARASGQGKGGLIMSQPYQRRYQCNTVSSSHHAKAVSSGDLEVKKKEKQ
jgi:hypothetical protein